MGLSEDFQFLKEIKKEKHQEWYDENIKIINDSKIPYEWSSNDKTCMLFRSITSKFKVDFYPHTGRWKHNNKIYRGGASRFIDWYKRRT